MNESLFELKQILDEELKRITSTGELSPERLEAAKEVVCLLEKISKIEENDMETEMSYRSGNYNGNSNYASYYDGSRSMRRGGSSRGYARYNSYNNYNRGMSGHSIKDRMIDKLESMIDEAQSDYERKTVMEWIERLGQEK